MLKERTIHFASSNAHKKAEMERLIETGFSIVLPCEEGLSFSAEENADSFIGNALIKARELYRLVKAPVLSDDSGLVVDCLDGRPGVRTARYGCTDERTLTSQEQYTLLLEEMKGESRRTARFVSACVLMLSEERVFIAQETVEGTIAEEPSGAGGFGYDPIFIPEGKTVSMAELSADEKNALSHRGRAMRRLNAILREMAREEE